jgi:hypothetical protein
MGMVLYSLGAYDGPMAYVFTHVSTVYSSQELTCIPQSIGDLGKFFVTAERAEHTNATGGRLFSRSKTTPISTSYQSRSFERTTSISEASTGLAKDQIQLYLYANKIQKLPRELFSLTKMTVLSLRRCLLTDIFYTRLILLFLQVAIG